MKELSIEEKAKRYDGALKVLHKYDGANIMFSQSLKEEMFPELAESEDEMTRREIISALKFANVKGVYDKHIAWLEKQKPAEWSEECEKLINRIEGWLDTLCDYLKDSSSECIEDVKDIVEQLKSLRPQNRWKPSDEQIKVCKEVYADLLSAKGYNVGTVNSEINRLEEQLKTLKGNSYD